MPDAGAVDRRHTCRQRVSKSNGRERWWRQVGPATTTDVEGAVHSAVDWTVSLIRLISTCRQPRRPSREALSHAPRLIVDARRDVVTRRLVMFMSVSLCLLVGLGYVHAECFDQDFTFEYVSHLDVHKQRYPHIPPWTFVGNLPASTESFWAARVRNDSTIDPNIVVNATVDELILASNGSRVVINTTVADQEDYYVFCMRYPGTNEHEKCQQCEFVEAQWLLAWRLRDFTVVSQKRSQTWIELEYSKVWDLPFPIFAETTAFIAEKSDSKDIRTGPVRSRKTIDLIKTYNFVNLTDLEPGMLYVITANITFNLSIPISMETIAPLNLHMPQWAHKRFYTATLPLYEENKTVERSRPSAASRYSSCWNVLLLFFAVFATNCNMKM